jgi:hypothetical protein
MGLDRAGLKLAGSAEAVMALDRAVDALLRFSPDTMKHLDEARRLDPECSMAAVLSAYIGLASTDARALGAARSDLESSEGVVASLTDRERLHRRAAGAWLAGRAHEASEILDAVLVEHPGDLVALVLGHQLDFLLGDAAGLERRPAWALGQADPQSDRTGFIHGMLAFGLEECGDYPSALVHAHRATERSPEDVWAIHAGAHVYEMEGDVVEGLAHLDRHRFAWQADNWMHNHTAWHRCLFLLAEQRFDEVLEAYDSDLRHTGPEELPMPLADAASLLWRIELAGGEVGGRWEELAAAWAGSLTVGFYPFNDVHATMALVRGGEPGAAQELLGVLATKSTDEDEAGALSVGRRVAEGLMAFGQGDDRRAVDALVSTRGQDHAIGGSLAQRDIIELTTIAAAERSDQLDLARSLVSARLARQPLSPQAIRLAGQLGVATT